MQTDLVSVAFHVSVPGGLAVFVAVHRVDPADFVSSRDGNDVLHRADGTVFPAYENLLMRLAP